MEESRGGVCACLIPGRWPPSRLTDYRSLILPRRWITHQRSSVNHQSPLNSHYRQQHPPYNTHVITHTHAHRDAHIRRGCSTDLGGDEFCWRINSNSARTPPLLAACTSPCLPDSLVPPTHLSLLSLTSLSPRRFFGAPLSVGLLPPLCSSSFFTVSFCLHVVSKSLSPSPTPSRFVPRLDISLPCRAGPSCRPGSTRRANHRWHFKRRRIKWLAVVPGRAEAPLVQRLYPPSRHRHLSAVPAAKRTG